MTTSCEHGNEPWGSIKSCDFLNWLKNCKVVWVPFLGVGWLVGD